MHCAEHSDFFYFLWREGPSQLHRGWEGIVVLNKGMTFPDIGFRGIVMVAFGQHLRRGLGSLVSP